MMPGETILSGAPQICGPGSSGGSSEFLETWDMHPQDESGRPVTVDVLWDVYKSAAGYYIGTYCPHCGPHSRESVYLDKETAERYYAVWLNFIVDGKFDLEKYEADGQTTLPGERY